MKRKLFLDDQLWIELIAMLMSVNGLFFYLVDGDGSVIFYATSLLAGLWLLVAIIKAPLLFLKEHVCELVFCGVCIYGILRNSGISDVYSWIRLIEVGVFMVALTTNPKYLTVEQGKQYFDIMIRILVGITLIFMAASFVLEIVHLFGGVGFSKMNYYEDEVFGGLYGNGNRLAIHAFISLFLSIYLYKENKKKIYVLNIILEGVGIILSGCRSVLLACLILAFLNNRIILGLIKDENKRRLAKVCLIGVGVLGASAIILATISKSSIYFQHGFGNPDWWLDKLSGGRLNIWKEAYAVSQTSPVFGVGLNNIRAVASSLLPDTAVYNARGYENAHNMIVNLLAYTGYIGLICVGFIFKKYRRIVLSVSRRIPNMRILMMLLVGLLMIDQLDIVITFANYMAVYAFFLILGLFSLYARKIREGEIHE